MFTENEPNRLMYSKVMLFGEYTIIVGSMGLTIPFSHFNGQLDTLNGNSYTDLSFARRSNVKLSEYFHYLKQKTDFYSQWIDLNRLEKELQEGLFFESSIPESYGLGSSGALVAAIYYRYAKKRIDPDPHMPQSQLHQLRQNFSQLEGFFHGTSSGIDPLICYLNYPLCLENQKSISAVRLPMRDTGPEDVIFLFNSGNPGKTAPLVEQFMLNLSQFSYQQVIYNEMVPVTNQCISLLVAGELELFVDQLKILSALQFRYFQAMIPNSVHSHWEYGLNHDLFTLKLCGSGGGGFVLGFTRRYSDTSDYFAQLGKEIIPVYQKM
jgi:mevalonate kinase